MHFNLARLRSRQGGCFEGANRGSGRAPKISHEYRRSNDDGENVFPVIPTSSSSSIRPPPSLRKRVGSVETLGPRVPIRIHGYVPAGNSHKFSPPTFPYSICVPCHRAPPPSLPPLALSFFFIPPRGTVRPQFRHRASALAPQAVSRAPASFSFPIVQELREREERSLLSREDPSARERELSQRIPHFRERRIRRIRRPSDYMMHRPSASLARARCTRTWRGIAYCALRVCVRTRARAIPAFGALCGSAGRSIVRNGCKTYAAWSILYLTRFSRARAAIHRARGNGNGIASAARAPIVFRRCKWAGRQIYTAAWRYREEGPLMVSSHLRFFSRDCAYRRRYASPTISPIDFRGESLRRRSASSPIRAGYSDMDLRTKENSQLEHRSVQYVRYLHTCTKDWTRDPR